MPEKKSLLDQIDAESQLKDGDSPFKRLNLHFKCNTN